jgi:hypothetical protein
MCCGRPIFRFACRHVACGLGVWGRPAVILGAGRTGGIVAETLLKKPFLGLVPMAFLDDDPNKIGTTLHGIPVTAALDKGAEVASHNPAAIAVLALPSTDRSRLQSITKPHRTIQSSSLSRTSWGQRAVGLDWESDGISPDIRHKLLDPIRQLTKRVMELAIIC